MAGNLRICFFFLFVWLALASSLTAQVQTNDFEAKAAALWKELPAPQVHFEEGTEAEALRRQRGAGEYQAFLQEKLQGQWFAALISAQPDNASSIQARCESWKSLLDFLLEREDLVEVWAYSQGGEKPRRIPATEFGEMKRQRREQPTFLTITYRQSAGGELVTNRLEFNFKAASDVLAANASYQRHREMELAAREALGARDAQGKLSSGAQWEELGRAAREGRLPLTDMPPKPSKPGDLFVALEYEVDSFNNFTNIVRIYRQSEIERRVDQNEKGEASQVLIVKKDQAPPREVRGFRRRGLSDELEPAPNPVPGQDMVELRVRNPNEPDVRKWNVLEFGEQEIVEE